MYSRGPTIAEELLLVTDLNSIPVHQEMFSPRFNVDEPESVLNEHTNMQ